MRIHGTTAARPLEMFTELEAPCLLAVPAPYDVPVFTRVKVHRDFHVEVARALYSVPEQWIGQHLDARADSDLVKLYSTGSGAGRLVKTHPRQPPGGRSTDRLDLPEHKAGYAMRDLTQLITACAGHGENIGIYAERLLDDPLPWTRMRSVYRLLGLVRRYGPGPVETACSRSLDLDVVSVSKVASMLEKAIEREQPALPLAAGCRGRQAATPHVAHPGPATTVRPEVAAVGPRGPLGSGQTVTFAFAGDCHFADQWDTEGGAVYTGVPVLADRVREDPTKVLAPIAPVLSGADLTMVNLETAITARGEPVPGKNFHFRSPAESFIALKAAGVDVVNMANNHALDYGPVGMEDTFAAIASSKLPVVGIGHNATEAYRPYRTVIKGVLHRPHPAAGRGRRGSAGSRHPGHLPALGDRGDPLCVSRAGNPRPCPARCRCRHRRREPCAPRLRRRPSRHVARRLRARQLRLLARGRRVRTERGTAGRGHGPPGRRVLLGPGPYHPRCPRAPDGRRGGH